jgi:hypothetical protein
MICDNGAHGRYKPVSTPGQRLDVRRAVGLIADRRANLLDAVVDALLEVDMRIPGPHRPLDFLAREDSTRLRREQREDLEGLLAQFDGCSRLSELPASRIELERAEPQDGGMAVHATDRLRPRAGTSWPRWPHPMACSHSTTTAHWLPS